MPKIIPDIENKILSAARSRLLQENSKNFSMRSIAAECGISAGSIYNYYRSKNVLIAAVMMDDWKKALSQMQEHAENAEGFAAGIEAVRRTAADFIGRYRSAWHAFGSDGCSVDSQSRRHRQMIDGIMKPVSVLLERFATKREVYLARLVSELVLTAALHQDIHPGELKQLCGYLVKENH